MADKRPTDVNALAARVVAEATGQVEKTEPPPEDVVEVPTSVPTHTGA
ncbi:MAG: hypothetical protein QOE45_1737 [Frankiaceae bacterium]|jgi:hypothetical protein|nr:hypothetical protein [Frankiaceae bacterium]